jgi:hypothetical protein
VFARPGASFASVVSRVFDVKVRFSAEEKKNGATVQGEV